MGKAKIAITIGDLDRLFNSGIHQNALTLKKVLESSGFLVALLNPFSEVRKYSQLDGLKTFPHTIVNQEKFDVIINVSFTYPIVDALRVREKHGTKLVSCQYGNRYENYLEKMFVLGNTQSLLSFKKDSFFDARWISPHFEYHKDWLEVVAPETKVDVCPYVWNPDYLVNYISSKFKNHNPTFDSENSAANVSIHEPNLSRLKNCMIPMSIASHLNRKNPELISKLVVTNSQDLVKDERFVDIVNRLGLVEKAQFVPRYHTGDFLCSGDAGTVVAHQVDCELNYLYLDYLYYGYPLVHNSAPFKDVGYYYPDQDIKQASAQLQKAIETHHDNFSQYQEKSKELIWKYHYKNKDNAVGYTELIEELLS